MCGFLICNEPWLEKDVFLQALDMMNHRGPDTHGYADASGFKVGHRRLKILDMSDCGNQPFIGSDGRHIIVYNGEIYNYKHLASSYNVCLKTNCDTELLLELYLKLGRSMLDHLNGMFAFAILDIETGSIFAARDRLGIKSLYMKRGKNGTMALSSEIAPLISIYGTPDIDETGLRQYRKLRTFFNGRTLYKNIEMFPPAHYLENDVLRRYWELPLESKPPPSDEELKELITSSVEARLLSDVPVGSFLSGGLDSTIVAGLSKRPHTWTSGFQDCNEFDWGRIASRAQDSIHHEITVNSDEFFEEARRLIKKRMLPLSVPNEVLISKMCKDAKPYVTVILSGEGADEMFFGYNRIFQWAYNSKHFDIAKFSELYCYGTHHDDEIVEDVISPFNASYTTPLDIVASFFQIAHLHGLLLRLDYASMQHSIEARVPFVDHRLVERIAGTPFTWKIEHSQPKRPLKRVFASLVPNPILQREKVGFPVPLDRLFKDRQPLTSSMDAWLSFNLKCLGIEADKAFEGIASHGNDVFPK